MSKLTLILMHNDSDDADLTSKQMFLNQTIKLL